MKKILFISNITNKISNFSLPSIYAAQKLGYEFHLAANLSNFEDDANDYNIKIHHINIQRNPLNKKNLSAYKEIISLMQKEKFDVIHCNTPTGGLLGRVCGKKMGTRKIIYTAHGFHFFKGAPLKSKTILKWTEMCLARITDAIITINEEDYISAQKFKLRKDGKVFYLPGVGVDTNIFNNISSKKEELTKSLNIDSDSILIISVGELNKNKNNKVILKSLGKLKNPKIHYILCGVGDLKDELIALSQDLNIVNNVHFFGFRNDIFQLLKSSDIFVLPSYREGLSRSLMEAMSVGLPCIVSEIRGNTDLIKNGVGGFTCKANDINEFSSSINTLVQDYKLRREMATNNQIFIKKFDVKNIINKVYKIYIDIL